MEKEEREMQKAIDCVMQHIESFRLQDINEETAHFGKPCSECIHSGTCKFDWLNIMKPLRSKSKVKFKLRRLN